MTITRTVLLASVLVGACRGEPQSVITDVTVSRRLVADVTVQFTKADDASNRAVLADTDEASVAAAREAERLVVSVRTDVAALDPRLRRPGGEEALAALEVFRSRFAEYEKVDREMLALAVENTNLKAQRLSFGPARAAADALRDSLQAIVASGAGKDRCRVAEAAATAVTAVREIEVLWAPHIAEADDAAMTRLEKELATLEAKARGALATLSGLVSANEAPALANARSSLDRFASLGQEIVRLSRRNTNVRSLDLALRRKPALTAACDESLRKLQEAMAKDPYPATR